MSFLPEYDPLSALPAPYRVWDDTARDLPKLLASGTVRPVLDAMPVLDPAPLLGDPAAAERAMLLLSYFGHAYVWGETEPAKRIPAPVAVPWHAVARRLGRPPVLSYASYALHNWRRLDKNSPIALGNLALLQNFLGGVDEEWFILVHVDIEAKAGPAMEALMAAQRAVERDDARSVSAKLETIRDTLGRMYTVLLRMPERCDPYIYYQRVRPYIHGWKDHPALPDGVIYEGLSEYAGKPQQFRGETGAQSSIIPALDAGLGVRHPDSPLSIYLREMRSYMPPADRAFLEELERGPSIREYARKHPDLHDAYNDSLKQMERFRALHRGYAATYIMQQHERSAANPTGVGTGGTPFMQYLEEHRQTTLKHLL